MYIFKSTINARTLFLILLASVLAAGCVTRHVATDFNSQVQYFDRINKWTDADGKTKIVFINGKKVKPDSLFIAADSLHYLSKTNGMIAVHNAFVEKVVFFKRGKGVLQGLIAGPTSLTVAAIALAFSDSDTIIDSDEPAFRSLGEFLGFITITAASGAGLGLIIGTINGQQDIFPIRKAYQQFNNSRYAQHPR